MKLEVSASLLQLCPSDLVCMHMGQLQVMGTGSKAVHKSGSCGFAYEEKFVYAEARSMGGGRGRDWALA